MSTHAKRGLFIGKVWVDALTFSGALDAFDALVASKRGGRVYTPNVDHVVIAENDPRFARAYERVDLSFADGMPLLVVSKLRGTPLPAKVSGSDFVMPLMERAALRGWRVYFLGGAEGIGAKARDILTARFPKLEIVGTDSARVDIDATPEARAAEIARVSEARPDVVLVALGAPKQEIWIDQVADALAPAVLIGVGASLDFVAGASKRAPEWVSKAGLEWLHRLAHDPVRLWRRYLVRDAQFPAILLRQMVSDRKSRKVERL